MRRVIAGTAAVVLAMAWVVVGLGQAEAAPGAALPVAAFEAPRCPGETDLDPTDPTAHQGLDNLLSVSGTRLDAYDAGAVVPLYDASGETTDAPLCGTRYVAGAGGTAGAVSQWMFCTSWADDLCGDVNEDGQATDSGGNPIDPMDSLASNPDLAGTDAERLIAYLIENGHTYEGSGAGYQFGGIAYANADESTNTRRALQVLVWCISDPTTIPDPNFTATCALNFPDGEQARLLALIPATPVADLSFEVSGGTVNVGGTARFTMRTNVFDSPIMLTASPLGAFSVCSGDATITDSVLTVAPPADGSSEVLVDLCVTATEAGPATVTATTSPPSVRRMSWNRSVASPPAQPCQIYAAFADYPVTPTTSSADATFVAVPTPTPDPTPDPTPTPTPTPTDPPTPTPNPSADPSPTHNPSAAASVLPLTPAKVVGVASAFGSRSRVMAPHPALAHTGADEGSMLLLAGASGLAGVVLVFASRLRRRGQR